MYYGATAWAGVDDGPEVFTCTACGHEATDSREPCRCEVAQLQAHGLLPFAWEEALIVAADMDAAFGRVEDWPAEMATAFA